MSPRLFLGVCSDTLGPGKGTKCPWVSPRPGGFVPDAHRCAVQGLGDTQHLPPRPQTPWAEIGQEVPDPPRLCPHPGCVPEVSATPTWGDPAGVWLWAGDTLTPGPSGLSPQGTAGRDRVAQEARPPVSCDSRARPGAQWGRGHKIPLPQRSPGTLQPEPEAGGRGGACHGCHRPRGNSEARVGTLSWGAAPTGLYKHKPDPMGAGADLGVQKALNRRWGGSDVALLIPSVPPQSPAVITRILPTWAQSRAGVTAPPRTPGPPPRASVSPLGAPPTLSTRPLAAPGAPRSPTRVRDRSVQGGAVPGGGARGVQGVAAGSGALPAGVFLEPVASSPSCDGDGI